MIRLKTAVCLFIIFLASGCVKQPIAYQLNDISKIEGSSFAPFTIAVAEFKDVRQIHKEEKSWFKEDRITSRNGNDWYFNNQDYYKDKIISPWISEMIVKHVDQSGIFKNAKLQSDASDADYILEGAIQRFEGFKEPSLAARIGAQFAVIGALATLGVKSRYEGTTVLIDVKLKKRDSDNVLWNGTVEGKVEGEDYADAYGWSAYQKANESLKVAVNQLIEKLKELSVDMNNSARPHAALERVPH